MKVLNEGLVGWYEKRYPMEGTKVPKYTAMARANAVILLSGGVDSATAAAIAKQQGFDLHALSFRYGQRHERELASAQQVAAFLAGQGPSNS